jgi:hypothetical protein
MFMYAAIEAAKAAGGPITNPITGNTYVLNSRGGADIATADVPWFQALGFVAGAATTAADPGDGGLK